MCCMSSKDKKQSKMPKSAAEFKEAGNRCFGEHKYEEAINWYSKALELKADPAYYTNRSLCYIKLKDYTKAAADCRTAIELDSRNVKANFFLGKILFYQNQFDESLVMLTRAQDSVSSQKLNYGDEITAFIRQVRKERFRIEEDKRISQEIELQSYLNELIDRDITQRVDQLLNKAEQTNDESIADKIEEIKQDGSNKREEVNSMFAQLDERRQRRDIPDYLCGRISFELLKDPVITPSGITYDRANIKEHLSKVGHFDPVTRAPLTADQLIPNLIMKEVLDDFQSQNPWALSL
ncbi:RING-type E3 ubiquitin transferase [Aphelenchoides bicaudatus]|nr:RING-type E3 ubiquitin transferase [Aphelenchoides bicaudatus]